MTVQKPTVFIVGAGAHVDYGMPTGAEIIDGLARCVEGTESSQWKDVLAHFAPEAWETMPPSLSIPLGAKSYRELLRANLDQLSRRLAASTHGSIDELLGEWNELELVGRRLLACLLLLSERNASRTVRIGGLYSWIGKVCAPRLDSHGGINQASMSSIKNVTIITFNYDRLAERYLTRIKNNTSEIYSSLPLPKIHHVYGVLSGCEDLQSSYSDYKIDERSIRGSIQSIELIRPRLGVAQGSIPHELLNPLMQAEQVVFVGFGFHDHNIRKLFIPSVWNGQHREIFATGYGLSERDKQRVLKALQIPIIFGGDSETCESCLRRWEPNLLGVVD